ncbi:MULTISPECIES: RNA polymerase sigma factor FliA [Marinobacter]|uniref:RNA polymerase sigma factor FliA n=1 Tax=Marinobacter xiaoshiensis TaxID=3073652 RepID=A0ABU2HES9_9GAMM|nr:MULTISPECIES: RNA polymerase sigma factor FliA [unclassified Marinobacter]MBK1872088.1 RNA polymerase sigma factor FliA [Marinobacter sp. 1-3A]MBK1885534.1 RNA polymerase sigma factor FliA [Marinobacter sp. DY40_1A1]MDS1309578.1 RNA polymerase sigma factor FliA [Marinobacter sp. F60267]
MTLAKNLGIYHQAGVKSPSDLIETHAPLVKKIALHLLARLPASVQLDDLMQAGMIGLLEAAQRYSSTKGATFETYAGIRIRGSMVDEIRKGDWVPRSVHRNARRVARAIKEVEDREGREAQDFEVAEELDMSLSEYHATLADANSGRLFSLDELNESGELPIEETEARDNPLDDLTSDSFRSSLAAEIELLPEREKLVLSLYYTEELNLKEIGAVLGVSESRVSQIHSQAALRLRGRLSEWRLEEHS